MEVFGLLLWGLSFAVVAGVSALLLGQKGAAPGKLERAYVLVSLLSLPLVFPLVTSLLSPGLKVPVPFFIVALVRAFAGVLLGLLAAPLLLRSAAGNKRMFAALVLTAAANLLPFLSLAIPRR